LYYKWDWGDGTYSDWIGPANSGQTHVWYHDWSQWGLYKVKVKAKDVYGGESSWSVYSQSSQSVCFNDLSQSYYNIVSWVWDFGDGNFSYTQNASHTYAADGVYTVTLNVTDSMSFSNVSSQLVYIDSVQPVVDSVISTPDTVGFSSGVAINASVFDNLSGIGSVWINVTYPDSSYDNFTVDLSNGSFYEYVFDDTWVVGLYNYTIWVYDKSNNSISSSGYSFNVSTQANIGIATLKDSYGHSEVIEITDPPNPPENYMLVDRGLTWNKYYDATSGSNVLEAYTSPVNYQEDNGAWTPINCSIEQLSTNHPAYNYGYRAGNEQGLYNVYFKPNVQGNWPVAFAYNKSDDPNIHVFRSKLVGIGYLDPASDWAYEYLQSVQSCQGQFTGNKVVYEDVFSGTDVVWSYDNMELKEEIILSNTTKSLLQNHPPSLYGLQDESSYLVFITKLDYQNLILYNDSGVLNGNVTVSDWVAFKDIFGYFKCALPVGDAYELYNESVRHKLVYRILQYNGNYYLLSGLKVQDLNNMVFPVVIDPTITITGSESDGYIYRSGSNYNNAWSAEEGTVSSEDSYISIGQSKVATFPPDYRIRRGFFIFDTSELPSNACIDNATLSLYKKDDYSDTDFTIMVQNGQPEYPHDPLEERDYNKVYYSGNGGGLNTVNFVNGCNNITITELSWINAGGVTKLCLRSSRDINGTAPTGSEYVNVHSANIEEEQNPDPRPKLIITYRNQSKIKNTGSTNITGYLLMQVQYLDDKWVVDHNTVDEASPREILVGDQLALDEIFNGLVNTDDLCHGSGTYRVYAAFRNAYGDVLVCDDKSLLEAWYEFTVVFE
jgi:PKD repeat protein